MYKRQVWEQLTLDFSEPLHRPKTLPGKEEAIDLILPCYNPQEGWERLMIEKHAELVKMLKGRSLRFIVVNDASKRGFTKDAVERLLEALPDTMIVSYDTNKGKGAAVRAGLSHSTSSITLYTDYDFPYEADSICRDVYKRQLLIISIAPFCIPISDRISSFSSLNKTSTKAFPQPIVFIFS